MAFAHDRTITVALGDSLALRPMLVRYTETTFKSVANGGDCETLHDLACYADSGLTELIPFEVEKHNLTTGELVVWAEPAEGAAHFYMGWGDAAVIASLANIQATWPGYVQVHHCGDNAANATVFDSSPRAVNATMYGPGSGHTDIVHTDPGLIGDDFTLPGLGGPAAAVYFISSTAYAGSASFAIHARIKPIIGVDMVICSRDNNLGGFDYILAIKSDGHLYFDKKTFGGIFSWGDGGGITGATALVSGEEHTVEAVFDGTTNTGYIYIDRVLDGSQAGMPDDGLGFANRTNWGTYKTFYNFHGELDECRFYYGVLAPDTELPPVQPPIVYENPCEIKTPLIFSVIKTPTHWTDNIADEWDYFRFANASWRDPVTRFGGGKQPRYLKSSGGITRQATDFITGNWTAGTFSPSWADTDYELRDWLGTHEGSLRGSEILHFLWSNEQRLANGDPTILYGGKIRTDKLDANLVYSAECYDPIGYGYSVLSRETMIPQRELEGDFPGYGLTGKDSLNIDFLCAPWIGGTHSDEGDSFPKGRIPVIYVGQVECLDTVNRHCGLIAGHACHLGVIQVRKGDGNETTAGTPLSWGSSAYGPGQTGWSGVNPSGASLYTVINGRTYTLIFLDVGSDDGDGFATGSVQLFANMHGFCVNGDGSGGEVTNLHDQFLLVLVNCILQSWETGDWLDIPEFEYDVDRTLPIIDEASWATAKATAASSYLATGFLGAFVLGVNGKQQSQADVLAQFAVQSHSSFARNKYHQYFIQMLDLDRTVALGGRRTRTDVRDVFKSLPLVAGFDEQMLANNLRGAWRMNYRTGQYEVLGQAGGGTPQAFLQFGNKVAEPETFTLISDTDTVAAVGLARLAFRAAIKRPVVWRESLCGLSVDVLDVVPMSHFNGLPSGGYVDRALWIRKMTVNEDMSVDFEALDVNDLLVEAT